MLLAKIYCLSVFIIILNFKPFQGHVLERLCNKTEFEVEGWRKIPPLIEILEHHLSADAISRMRLKMPTRKIDIDENNKRIRTIKDSWIYTHFKNSETKDTKIAVYVNALLPINQNLFHDEIIRTVVSHSVLVKGIKQWKNDKNEKVECLELEIHDESEETRFIPVECPFFEEVRERVMEIFRHTSETWSRKLDRYGEQLAEMKWGKMKRNWYTVEKDPHPNSQIGYWPYRYQMLFVRAIHPCYQLKFTC